MKKTIIIVLLFAFNSNFAQQDLINELLGIKYNYKTFNFKGKVKQMDYQSGLKQGMGFSSKYKYKYNFDKKGNLIYVTYYKYKVDDDDRNNEIYTYNKRNNLSEINKVEGNKPIENYYFYYDENGNLIQINFSNVRKRTFTNYYIEWKNNKPIKYIVKEGSSVIYQSFNHQFDSQNNIIKYDFDESGDLGYASKKYDENGNILNESYVFKNNASYNLKVENTYKKDNDILIKIEDGETVNYEYSKLDSHNNWRELRYNYLKLHNLEIREFTYYK